MNFEKIMIKLFYSKTPERYERILVRWEAEDKPNKLIKFEDFLSAKFTKKPSSGRFYNKKKWKSINYFYEIINILGVSKNQLEVLKNYKIKFDIEKINFLEAQKLINDKEEQLKQIREAEIKRVGNLPITSYSFNKLKKYGINVSKDITRTQGNELIFKYEMDQQLRLILNDFSKRNEDIFLKIEKSISHCDLNEMKEFVQELQEMNGYFNEFDKTGFEFILPKELNLENIKKLNIKFENALFELEDVIEQVKDRYISTFEGDFRIIGKLSKSNFKKFNLSVINKILNDKEKFDFDSHILEMIVINFPEVKIKAKYY
ncbi:hypothetical protein [Marinicella gelatinilytica]|uniref:hypothetical protein n=1 Tax=Marinicella gelatinilytica TaxID=2996017 RepID=UPI002260DCFF|nr:hypothetical protein [Marinicella gelatinilytica]MCX7545942.1 hypothetical protein [Marinicella gelatinilytica]